MCGFIPSVLQKLLDREFVFVVCVSLDPELVSVSNQIIISPGETANIRSGEKLDKSCLFVDQTDTANL